MIRFLQLADRPGQALGRDKSAIMAFAFAAFNIGPVTQTADGRDTRVFRQRCQHRVAHQRIIRYLNIIVDHRGNRRQAQFGNSHVLRQHFSVDIANAEVRIGDSVLNQQPVTVCAEHLNPVVGADAGPSIRTSNPLGIRRGVDSIGLIGRKRNDVSRQGTARKAGSLRGESGGAKQQEGEAYRQKHGYKLFHTDHPFSQSLGAGKVCRPGRSPVAEQLDRGHWFSRSANRFCGLVLLQAVP